MTYLFMRMIKKRTLLYGWKFIKEHIKENLKISISVSLLFIFLLGFVVGAIVFKPDPRPIFEIAELDVCLERLAQQGTLVFKIEDLTRNCIWPIPSTAICNLNVCGHTIKTKVTGIV